MSREEIFRSQLETLVERKRKVDEQCREYEREITRLKAKLGVPRREAPLLSSILLEIRYGLREVRENKLYRDIRHQFNETCDALDILASLIRMRETGTCLRSTSRA